MDLFLERGQNYAFLLEMIVHYLKLEQRGKINLIYLSAGTILAQKKAILKIQTPSLVTPEGNVLTEVFDICRKLFEVLPQWKQFFLGSTQLEIAEINTIKANLKEGKQFRKHLQKHLESKTFFVSNHLTFADFYMFTQLYDNVIQLTDEQKNQYTNIFRWYRHFQNLPEILEFLTTSNRFLVKEPQVKVNFLAPDKKKQKKEKGEEVKKEKIEEVAQ